MLETHDFTYLLQQLELGIGIIGMKPLQGGIDAFAFSI
jgi:hypothetical protein